jgi:hypothetical protein
VDGRRSRFHLLFDSAEETGKAESRIAKPRRTDASFQAMSLVTHPIFVLEKGDVLIARNEIQSDRSLTNAHEYDIIHVHHPDPMAALALFCSGYKGRVVLHWHSDILKQKVLLKFYMPLQRWLLKRAEVLVGTTPIYVKESPLLN